MEQEWGLSFPSAIGCVPYSALVGLSPVTGVSVELGVPCPQPPGSSGWHRAWTALRPQHCFALFLGTRGRVTLWWASWALWGIERHPWPPTLSPDVTKCPPGWVGGSELQPFGCLWTPPQGLPPVDPQTLAMRSASLAPGATVWEPGTLSCPSRSPEPGDPAFRFTTKEPSLMNNRCRQMYMERKEIQNVGNVPKPYLNDYSFI